MCSQNNIVKIKTLHYESWEIIVNNFNLSLSLSDRTYFTVCVSGGTSAIPGVISLYLITLLFLKTSHVLEVVFKNGLFFYITLCFLHWHFNILLISNDEEILSCIQIFTAGTVRCYNKHTYFSEWENQRITDVLYNNSLFVHLKSSSFLYLSNWINYSRRFNIYSMFKR